MKSRLLFSAPAVLAASVISCVNLGGIGHEGEARISGKVTVSNGAAAPQTRVMLLPADYDPVKDPAGIPSDTTDAAGNYSFAGSYSGRYSIQAVHLIDRSSAFAGGIDVSEDTVIVPDLTLQEPGAVKVMLPDTISGVTGYLYIPGTSCFVFLYNLTDSVVLDSVPAGSLPAISYSSTNDVASNVIRYDVPVMSGDTTVVWNPSWKYARRVFLNTSSSGANVPGTVSSFPLLVRLSGINFDFGQANAMGSDVRFTKPDNTFLPYEIERWDSLNGAAEVWVKTDTIYGGNNSQYIVMYWGNPDAPGVSYGPAVFDTADGFQGIWHFSGTGNATAYDATANRYDGTPHNMTAASSVDGAIGNAREFNGSSQYITMVNTASGKLNFPEDGSYSISVWVYAETLDTLWRAIAGKGHEQYYLQLKGLGSNRATWEFVEFQNQSGWEYTEDSVPPAPGSGTWLNLVGVRSGTGQRLYIDGQLAVNGPSLMAGSYSRVTSDNFTVGRYPRSVTIPYYQGWSYFNGRIDEVRVSSVVPGVNWIKLCYMNQKPVDALVEFR